MGGARGNQAEEFTRASLERSKAAFQKGMDWSGEGRKAYSRVLESGGEPMFMSRALDRATADAQDASILEDQRAQAALQLGLKGTIGGGNVKMQLTPETVGARMADLVARSSAARQNARFANVFEAVGALTGNATGVASEQTRNLTNQLQAISMAPKVDPTYANIIGALNAAGTIYGAGNGTLWNKAPVGGRVGTGEFTTGLGQLFGSPGGANSPPGTYGPQRFTFGGNPYSSSYTGFSGGWR